MSFIENNKDGLVYMSSDIIAARHAFTTRLGGVSQGDFASLNLGANRGDDPAAVKENYRRLCAFMGVGIDGMAVTKQVHGSTVRVVTETDRHRCLGPVPYEADGIVTRVKGLPILCMVADCVPVLLWDGENGVAGAIHCGWRSSVADILKNALEHMQALGAEAPRVRAAIGPSIGACCFETDDDVPRAIDRYLAGDTAGLFTRRPDGKTLVDLAAGNARRLLQLGVKPENIDISTECTMCSHEKYWSHRYTRGRRGSQGAVIVLD